MSDYQESPFESYAKGRMGGLPLGNTDPAYWIGLNERNNEGSGRTALFSGSEGTSSGPGITSLSGGILLLLMWIGAAASANIGAILILIVLTRPVLWLGSFLDRMLFWVVVRVIQTSFMALFWAIKKVLFGVAWVVALPFKLILEGLRSGIISRKLALAVAGIAITFMVVALFASLNSGISPHISHATPGLAKGTKPQEEGSDTAADRAVPTSGMSLGLAQRKLTELGYKPGSIDGVLGRRTKSAIQAFQRGAGLPSTGELDPLTVQALSVAKK